MDLAALIGTYGYWAVALGCLLEGETVLLLAGFAAHRGYLQWPVVVAVAAAAGFAGDMAFFLLGRASRRRSSRAGRRSRHSASGWMAGCSATAPGWWSRCAFCTASASPGRC